MKEVEVKECLSREDFVAAYPVVRLLRESLNLEEYLIRISEARKNGYRLFCGYSVEQVLGAIGLRILTDLCWGRNLYVDDLIVVESHRRTKIGTHLMNFAEDLARQEKCLYVRLASGILRPETHEFYEQIGYRKTSFAFARKLK